MHGLAVTGRCRWTSAALAILWNGRAFRRRLALRSDAVRIDAASRRASRGNARVRYPSFYRSQHLDRSSGSLIRESRIFGQIGSFSTGMARRTPVGPVRHLCTGRSPTGDTRENGEQGSGRTVKGWAAVISRGMQTRRRRISTVDWFPNFAGVAVDETGRDAMRRHTLPQLDVCLVTQALSTIRRRLGANRRACRRRGCVSSDVWGEVAERPLLAGGFRCHVDYSSRLVSSQDSETTPR